MPTPAFILQRRRLRSFIRASSNGCGRWGSPASAIIASSSLAPKAWTSAKECLRRSRQNVTRFFREPHHFEHLEKSVLPPLIKAARRGARVRFWSAGCSSGEEPYSIALTLLSAMPDAGEHDIKILATDIDTEVLGRAKKGIYAAADLDPVPAKLRARWFVPVLVSVSGGRKAESCSVAPQLKNLIAFRDLNLFGPWPMGGKFQAIFCRNVAIYFENSAQEQLWDRFASKLAAQGFLYIGHSEQITGAARHWFEIENVTTYRLKNPTGKLP